MQLESHYAAELDVTINPMKLEILTRLNRVQGLCFPLKKNWFHFQNLGKNVAFIVITTSFKLKVHTITNFESIDIILAWICKNAHDIANFKSIDILGWAQCQSNHFQVRELLQPQNRHRRSLKTLLNQYFKDQSSGTRLWESDEDRSLKYVSGNLAHIVVKVYCVLFNTVIKNVNRKPIPLFNLFHHHDVE